MPVAPFTSSNPGGTPGTEAGQEPLIDYAARWRAYAVRWYTAIGLLATWVPVSLALFWYSRQGWHEPLVALAVMLLWLGGALAAVYWQGEFRCPRCRRRYGALGTRRGDTNYSRGLWDRVCANCKLRKFEHG